MERVFRPRDSERNMAILCLVAFSSFAILGAVSIWLEAPPERRHLSINLLLPLFTSPLIIATSLQLLAYYRSQLIVNDCSLKLHGLRKSQHFDLRDTTSLNWYLAGGRAVVLQSASSQLLVHLSHYEIDERLWLIRCFRSSVRQEIQTGWPEFCQRIALPLRRANIPPSAPLEAGQVRLTRRRIDFIFLIGIAVATPSALIAAYLLNNPRLYLMPLLPVPIWLMLRFLIPPAGLVTNRLRADREQKWVLWTLAVMSAIGILGIKSCQMWYAPQQVPWKVAAVGCGTWFLVILIVVWCVDRRIVQLRRKRLPTCLAEWDSGEGLGANTVAPLSHS